MRYWYLISLTIGPTFISAAIYGCLARIVVVYGEQYSRFRSRTYTLAFITCDFISLVCNQQVKEMQTSEPMLYKET